MEFINLTPFAAMAYSAVDKHDCEYEVVVMRVVYQLRPCQTQPEHGVQWCEAYVIDEAAPNLHTEDQYMGEMGASDVLAESDLAPFKPKCDVLVTGHSYAPAAKPSKRWMARLRISAATPLTLPDPPTPPEPLNPGMEITEAQHERWRKEVQEHERKLKTEIPPVGSQRLTTLLDKTLMMHGTRQFERNLFGGWRLSDAQACRQVPLKYSLSYGGSSKVHHPQFGKHPDAPEFLLNEVCYTNPLGSGWQHKSLDEACKRANQPLVDKIIAPQIEYLSHPVQGMDQLAQKPGADVPGMAELAKQYQGKVAGFGPVGRAWTPRVQLSGTYDGTWLDERWPYLPLDFDFNYWNCAPHDQQIDYLPANAIIELGNLANPALAAGDHIMMQLPSHRASVLFHLKSGLMLGAKPVIDTLHIDTDKMQVALVWRCAVSTDMNIDRAELRYQIDPEQPLLKLDSLSQAALAAMRADDGDGETTLPVFTAHQATQGAVHG